MVLGSTQPLVKMSTRNIPGKGGRCMRLTTSPPSCTECHEIWEPKPPGNLWATPGLLRDCFTFLCVCMYLCMYIGFKTFFYVIRHLDSIASYLPTGLHLGFFRLRSSFSSIFLVLSFVLASTSMLFWTIFLQPFFERGRFYYHKCA